VPLQSFGIVGNEQLTEVQPLKLGVSQEAASAVVVIKIAVVIAQQSGSATESDGSRHS
jgi:hypothetical protein